MRTLDLKDPNPPSPGVFHGKPGSGNKNRFLIFGNNSYIHIIISFDLFIGQISNTKIPI
jgi:hypothetical protein